MAHKVLLVEDEKPARDFFLTALERETEGFEALQAAENGREGWKKVRELQPDVLVTDIRMPLMDGLELVDRVHKVYPHIITLVLSGYEEFEFARKAFSDGVKDYLLKPLKIEQFREVMSRISTELDKRNEKEKLSLFRCIIEEKAYPSQGMNDGNLLIRLGITREGGLVPRFSHFNSGKRDLVNGRVWILAGRDSRESVFIANANELSRKEFRCYLEEITSQDRDKYRTKLLFPKKIPMVTLKSCLTDLTEKLDRSIILGRSRFLEEPLTTGERTPWKKELEDNLEYMIINRDYGDVRKLLNEQLNFWESIDYPLYLLESSLKELLLMICRKKGNLDDFPETEILLELYLTESGNYGELSENLWKLVRSILELGESVLNDENLPEIFRGICVYIENHYNESIKLNEISSLFQLSPSYIGRLFTRHFQCSFSDYLRRCRIEGSRKLMTANPEMAVQDIARYCGYEDPFYFSKVFKQVTSLTPTQFKKGQDPD